MEKSWFIIRKSPSDGLFWHPSMDADLFPDARWDTGEFSRLLENVPLQETVLSDAFTSYRLTAYRDVYVMVRPKPSFAVTDQASRNRDYGEFVTAVNNPGLVCDVLRRYRSRWILFNSDPGYNLRGNRLWHPMMIKTLMETGEYFELVDTEGSWGLVKAKHECSPWPPPGNP